MIALFWLKTCHESSTQQGTLYERCQRQRSSNMCGRTGRRRVYSRTPRTPRDGHTFHSTMVHTEMQRNRQDINVQDLSSVTPRRMLDPLRACATTKTSCPWDTRLPFLYALFVQEDHQTQVETAEERVSAGRPVGRDYIPLSQSPQLSEMTFGRRNRISARLQASTPTATGAATNGVASGSGDTSGKGPPSSSLLASVTMHGRGSRHFESSSLAVVAAGAGAGTTARRASSGAPSPAAARQATMTSPGQGERQNQRHFAGGAMSSRRAGAAGRGDFKPRRSSDDYSSSGKNDASASPELLYASGRITAARYHEMLQEMDRSVSGPGLAGGGPGAGTSSRHAAVATVNSRGVGDTGRRSHPEHRGK